MSHRSIEEKFETLVQTQPAFNDALKLLKNGREIQILLEGGLPQALFYNGSHVVLEARAAQKPDIEFQISEAAIDEILSQEAPTMAAFGIIVVRQVATQKAQLRLLSSVFPVLTGGYLKIIQKAGPEFVGYLGQFGLKGVSGIRKFIQSMK